MFGGVDDHAGDCLAVGGGRESPAASLAGCLGVQVGAAPGRALLAHDRDDCAAELLDDVEGGVVGAQRWSGRVRGHLTCPRDGVTVQHLCRAAPPCCGEVGERVDVLLGSAGEGGPLAELHDCGSTGTSTVVGDVLLDQAVGHFVDVAGAAGELLDEGLWDSGDLPGGVAVAAAGASLPVDAEGAGEVVAEDGFVKLGDGDDPGVQRVAVDGAPCAVAGGLDAVADHDVGVQVRVVCSGVVVVERCGDHAGGVELCDATFRSLAAGAGGEHFAFQEVERFCDGGVVGVGDDRLRPGVGHSPQHARRLGDRERQVVGRDRVAALALHGLLEDPVPAAEMLAGDRVLPFTDQASELVLGDLVSGLDLALQTGKA